MKNKLMIRTENFFKNNKGKDIYINKAGQNWQIILPSIMNIKKYIIAEDGNILVKLQI